jgi:predicted transcriptional regulator
MVFTVVDILNALSDKEALSIFKTVSLGNDNVTSDFLMTKLKLTRKQYYSKMMALTKIGLIGRRKGKYFLTSLGKVICHFIIKFEDALNNYWKLKAIDSIQLSFPDRYVSKEEFNKIVGSLIDDRKIVDILLSVEEESNTKHHVSGLHGIGKTTLEKKHLQ